NVFDGMANVPQHRGTGLMMEVGGPAGPGADRRQIRGEHTDEQGNYLFGGVRVEHNLFRNVTGGNGLVLGKGNVRMRNTVVRNNVFDTNLEDAAILLTSPHENLVIENNVFR